MLRVLQDNTSLPTSGYGSSIPGDFSTQTLVKNLLLLMNLLIDPLGPTLGRYWLERLIREMTFVASFDQASSAISMANSLLRRLDSEFISVASALEDLLFHRLGREWDERCSLSSLAEQILFSFDLG